MRWSHLITPGGTVLDVAAGGGRHTRWLAAAIAADIEAGPWPLAGRSFDAVVVANYLWRPLVPQLLAALATGGVLLYETFAAGNETVGRPRRADFLLARGELLELAAGLRIVAYEDGFLRGPDRHVQRVAAVREEPGPAATRYPLTPGDVSPDR